MSNKTDDFYIAAILISEGHTPQKYEWEGRHGYVVFPEESENRLNEVKSKFFVEKITVLLPAFRQALAELKQQFRNVQ